MTNQTTTGEAELNRSPRDSPQKKEEQHNEEDPKIKAASEQHWLSLELKEGEIFTHYDGEEEGRQ